MEIEKTEWEEVMAKTATAVNNPNGQFLFLFGQPSDRTSAYSLCWFLVLGGLDIMSIIKGLPRKPRIWCDSCDSVPRNHTGSGILPPMGLQERSSLHRPIVCNCQLIGAWRIRKSVIIFSWFLFNPSRFSAFSEYTSSMKFFSICLFVKYSPPVFLQCWIIFLLFVMFTNRYLTVLTCSIFFLYY